MAWDIYKESTPVARKEHCCEECYVAISPGEQYYRFGGRYDGHDWEDHTYCQHCENAARWLVDAMSNAGYWADEVLYDIGFLYVSILEAARELKSFAGYRHAIGIKKRNPDAPAYN